MRLLLDTHILLWTIAESGRLSAEARALIGDPEHQMTFSAVSLKSSRGRADFRIDAGLLRRNLLDNGYAELAVVGPHAVMLTTLPVLHKDPFDRMLVAQALVEGLTLVTADRQVANYPGPVRLV